jgi:Lysophospholipase L1 and related esterases
VIPTPAIDSEFYAHTRGSTSISARHRTRVRGDRRVLAARMAVSATGWRKLLTITVPAAIAALLVFAAATEIWVRATWDPRKGTPGFFLSDPSRGQRLAAGYTGWFAGVPVHINHLELRDTREYDLAKGPRTFRILVLGDSVTFGHGSVYEHSYPYLLEQRLKEWNANVDWQVWNAAVPGYNTSQELAHLLEVGPVFKPDLVVVGFFENDLTANVDIVAPTALKRGLSAALSFAGRHVYSLELYKKVISGWHGGCPPRMSITSGWNISAPKRR